MRAQDLDSIRDLILANRFAEARARIQAFSVRRLDRPLRLRLAFFANEAYFPRKVLRLLGSVVRPRDGRKSLATPAEKAEYARALCQVGAAGEATQLLSTREAQAFPRAVRMLAFAQFQEWKWGASIPLLERALTGQSLTQNDELHIKVLLGAALLHGKADFDNARRVLHEVLVEAEAKQFRRVRWDAAQLLAQSHYFEGDWRQTSRMLDVAEQAYRGDTDAVPILVVELFRMLVALRKSAGAGAPVERLREIKASLGRLGARERARSVDLYLALAQKDRALATHVYFGTPYPLFRERLLAGMGLAHGDLPTRYTLVLNQGGVEPPESPGSTKSHAPRESIKASHSGRVATIDLETGAPNGALGKALAAGMAPHRALCFLCADFYRRPSIAQLHAALNPNEYFDPVSSADRVHQTVARLRHWVRANKLPLEIVIEHDQCWLRASRRVEFSIPRPPEQAEISDRPRGASQAMVARLGARFGYDEFRAADVEKLLGVSRPTAVTLLTQAIGDAKVVKQGSGPRVRYRLIKSGIGGL